MKKHTQGPWQFIEESTQICGAHGETVFFETGSATPEDCRLAAAAPELLRLLGVMFDAYENGTPCYEDPEEFAGPLGNAIKLDDAEFHKIADLLNELDPRG